jgi:hypothetical protein
MFRSPAVRRALVVLAISLVAPLSALALPASGTGRSTSQSVSLWEWLAASWSTLAPHLDLPGISKADTMKPLPDPAPQNRSEVGCTVDPNGACQGGRP